MRVDDEPGPSWEQEEEPEVITQFASLSELWVHELQGNTTVQVDSSRKNTTPISSRKLPKEGGKGWSYFWSSWGNLQVIFPEKFWSGLEGPHLQSGGQKGQLGLLVCVDPMAWWSLSL